MSNRNPRATHRHPHHTANIASEKFWKSSENCWFSELFRIFFQNFSELFRSPLKHDVWRCGKIRFLSIMARTDHLRAPSRNEKLQDAQACMMRDRDIRVRRNSKRIFGSLILSSTAGARDSFQRGWRSFEASKLRSLYPFRNALLSQQSTAITSKKATHTSAAGLFIIYKAKTKSIPFLCNEFVIFRHAIM